MSQSLKEKFIQAMNHIFLEQQIERAVLLTEDFRIYYLKLNDYEEFIHSDSESMKATPSNDTIKILGKAIPEVNVNDIIRIVYGRKFIDL